MVTTPRHLLRISTVLPRLTEVSLVSLTVSNLHINNLLLTDILKEHLLTILMDHLNLLPTDSLKVHPLHTDHLKEVHPGAHLLHMEVPLLVASQETTCSQFLRILQPMALMELRLIQPNKIGVATLEDRWEDKWEQVMADRWEDQWAHPWDNLVDKWEEAMVDKWVETMADKWEEDMNK